MYTIYMESIGGHENKMLTFGDNVDREYSELCM